MSIQNNDVLGYTTCEAGGRASVHRTNRGKARYLYTRCDCCGCDQRTGAKVQTRLYRETKWLGEAPEAPPNLITTENEPQKAVIQPDPEPKKQPDPEPKKQPDPEPKKNQDPEWEPEKEPKPEPKGGGFGFVAALGGCLAVLGFVLKGVR